MHRFPIALAPRPRAALGRARALGPRPTFRPAAALVLALALAAGCDDDEETGEGEAAKAETEADDPGAPESRASGADDGADGADDGAAEGDDGAAEGDGAAGADDGANGADDGAAEGDDGASGASDDRVPIEVAGPRGEDMLPYARGMCGDEAELVANDERPGLDAEELAQCPAREGEVSPAGPFLVMSAFEGDFSGDGEPEAIVLSRDTSARDKWSGRQLLLEAREGEWAEAHFSDAGAPLGGCEALQAPGRARLFCMTITVAQGAVVEDYVTVAAEGGELDVQNVTAVSDHAAACRFDGEFRRKRHEERLGDFAGDGVPRFALAIESFEGEPVEGFDPADEPAGRCDEDNYQIETSYELEVWELRDEGPVEGDPDDVREHLGDKDEWAPFFPS